MIQPVSIRCFSSHTNVRCDNLSEDILNYHDLTFCISGTMYYEINGVECKLLEGDAIYFAPGDKRKRFAFGNLASYTSFNFFAENRVFPNDYHFQKIFSRNLNKSIELYIDSHKKHHNFQVLNH